MASITLHRASRLQEQIRAAIGRLPLAGTVKLSIFAADPTGDVERQARRLRDDVERLRRLLAILAAIRGAVGRANSEAGIGTLLAEKAGAEEEAAILAKLVGDPRPPDASARRSRLRFEPEHSATATGAIDLAAKIQATRVRYEANDDYGETHVYVSVLDATAAADLRARIVALRRRLEEIADELRRLNGSVCIEIDDTALAELRDAEVV